MANALNGWHSGERRIQDRIGYADASRMLFLSVKSYMPEQHQLFYSRNLHFVPLTTLDTHGRPWVSLVAGAEGKLGFIRSPNETTLELDVNLWKGDPIVENLELLGEDKEKGGRGLLSAGVGIEFSTRRRNKFAGSITEVHKIGAMGRQLRMRVNQTIGNCPKYINVRKLVPYSFTNPTIEYDERTMDQRSRLPNEIINFILNSDTVWLGSSYLAREEDEDRFPSHVGNNARGGKPGFVRVVPSDGRTLVLPDYSGNRLLTSLGNIETSSLAAMTFLDWRTGDLLYTTGIARNVVGQEAQKLMPRQNVLSTMFVSGFVVIRDALPVRQAPGTEVERSPYSPPIKLLAEEAASNSSSVAQDAAALLIRIQPHSSDLATFTFEVSTPVKIEPGQTAVLDFSSFVGVQQYSHMAAAGKEASLNDDRIRTWTVSSFRGDAGSPTWKFGTQVAAQFSLTMREMPHGLVTGSLFSIMRQLQLKMPQLLRDSRPLKLSIPLVGISGSFILRLPPSLSKNTNTPPKFLWIAGGIGITPFLGFLDAMHSLPGYGASYGIVLLVATREPEVLLPLIENSFSSQLKVVAKLRIHFFISSADMNATPIESSRLFDFHVHKRRLSFARDQSMSDVVPDVSERSSYLCGPLKFEDMIMEALSIAGVDPKSVVREGFNY